MFGCWLDSAVVACGVLHFDAEGFEESAVLNAAGAGCFAAAAIEAGVEMSADGLGERQSAVDNRTHQVDATAGAIIFIPGFDVCGTSSCAEAAVDAVEETFVRDGLADDRQSCGIGGGGCGAGHSDNP